MRTSLIVLMLSVSLATVANAMTVTDPGEIAKTAELIVIAQKQLQQLENQFQQMMNEYNLLKQQYEALTAQNGEGDLFNSDSDKNARRWMANDEADIEAMIEQGKNPGDASDRLKFYEDKFPNIPVKDIDPSDPDSINRAYYITANERTKYNFMAADIEISHVKSSITRIEALMAEIKNTKSEKESTDLNTRMMGEVALLNESQINMQALLLNNAALNQQQHLNDIQAAAKFYQ